MDVISLFSGIGGLDLGFIEAGFSIRWSNDCAKRVEETYKQNIATGYFDNRKLEEIPFEQIPEATGIIGGLPSMGWSYSTLLNGSQRRIYIFDIIKLIRKKKPTFFLLETLRNFDTKKNKQPFSFFISELKEAGYKVSYEEINAKDYSIAQDRKRIYIVGFKNDLETTFHFPRKRVNEKVTMKDAIGDLANNAMKTINNQPLKKNCSIPNHEYYDVDYSTVFWSRNRLRSWDNVSFSIVGDRKHIPLHPDSSIPQKTGDIFEISENHPHRRLSISLKLCLPLSIHIPNIAPLLL